MPSTTIRSQSATTRRGHQCALQVLVAVTLAVAISGCTSTSHPDQQRSQADSLQSKVDPASEPVSVAFAPSLPPPHVRIENKSALTIVQIQIGYWSVFLAENELLTPGAWQEVISAIRGPTTIRLVASTGQTFECGMFRLTDGVSYLLTVPANFK